MDRYSIPVFTPNLKMEVRYVSTKEDIMLGHWETTDGFTGMGNFSHLDQRKFYRVGVVLGRPWAWVDNVPEGKELNHSYLDRSKTNLGLVGYCIDLLGKMATTMNFEYEIVPASGNIYGHAEDNRTWNGVIGDLVSGNIDIAVAALTIATEREEGSYLQITFSIQA